MFKSEKKYNLVVQALVFGDIKIFRDMKELVDNDYLWKKRNGEEGSGDHCFNRSGRISDCELCTCLTYKMQALKK